MPSHICHALLVEAALDSLLEEYRKPHKSIDSLGIVSIAVDPRVRSIAVLGSQGPDIFLHNHRRKPRAFRYGALLHRKGNARLISSLAESASQLLSDRTDENIMFLELAAFTLGYISHVWMDRIMHPYINYSAGWRGMPDKHPDRPAMHAFLERIIDVQLLRLLKNQSIQEYRFLTRLPSSGRDLSVLRVHIAKAIRDTLKSASDDSLLEQRLANALFDSLGYYRYTESPGPEYYHAGRERERAGTINPRWLSVVHPPEELLMIDGLNRERRRWQHPCDPSRTSNASVPTLFDRCLAHTMDTFYSWLQCAGQGSDSTCLQTLEEELGEENLNDGIKADPPCRRSVCSPLPLLGLYHRIKTSFDR